MDTIIDKPLASVSGWSILERDASGGHLMRWFAHFVYLLRKVRSHPSFFLSLDSVCFLPQLLSIVTRPVHC